MSWDEAIDRCKSDDPTKRIESREELAWVWAIFDAIRQYEAFDGYFVDRAAKGILSGTEVKEFARFYQVARTIEKGQDYDKIAEYANAKFPQLDSTNGCIDAYKKFCEKIKCCGPKGKIPRIFAAKLLWFYQPKHWSMFDNFSKDGLKLYVTHEQKKDVDSQFQALLRSVFCQKRLDDIDNMVLRLFGGENRYRYPLRMVDKFLYLRGSKFFRDDNYWVEKTRWMIDQSCPATQSDEILLLARNHLIPARGTKVSTRFYP